MKYLAQLHKGDKLIKNQLFEDDRELTPSEFTRSLQEIAYELDIATPVSLPTHFKHLKRFNRVKYLPRDFIEEVDFTSFTIEAVKEKR